MYSSKYVIEIFMILVIGAISHESSIENISTKNQGMANSNNKTMVSKQVASEGSVIPQNIVTKDPPRMGREHVTDKPHLDYSTVHKIPVVTHSKSENTSAKVASLNFTAGQKSSGIMEVTKATKLNSSTVTPIKAIEINSTTNKTAMSSTHMLNKTSNTVTISTNTNNIIYNSSKSTTRKPMKPIITEHDDIAVVDEKSEPYSPSISGIDTTFEKKTKQADYVVPIIAVILSIPLVTIIFTVLFKRSKDWWQHRNYRRMDYLIEGMYQS